MDYPITRLYLYLGETLWHETKKQRDDTALTALAVGTGQGRPELVAHFQRLMNPTVEEDDG